MALNAITEKQAIIDLMQKTTVEVLSLIHI